MTQAQIDIVSEEMDHYLSTKTPGKVLRLNTMYSKVNTNTSEKYYVTMSNTEFVDFFKVHYVNNNKVVLVKEQYYGNHNCPFIEFAKK